MTEPRTREEVLRDLRANYDDLARQLDGLSEEAASRQPAEKEWSIKEVLAHLLVCEEFAHTRLVHMVHETDPYLPAFDDHELLEVRGYRSSLAREILSALLAFGHANLALLAGLSDDQWQRTARHEERGRITIGYIADQMLAEHHREHLAQIQDLKEWLATQQG
jgi:hypothetical protein